MEWRRGSRGGGGMWGVSGPTEILRSNLYCQGMRREAGEVRVT